MATKRSEELDVLHVVGGSSHLGGVMAFVTALAGSSIPGVHQAVWKHRAFAPPAGSAINWVFGGVAPRTDLSTWHDLLGGMQDALRLSAWRKRHPNAIFYAHSRMGMISAAIAAHCTGTPLMMHMHARASRPGLYRQLWRLTPGKVLFNSRLTCLHYGSDPRPDNIVMPPIAWPTVGTRDSRPAPIGQRFMGAGMFVPWKNTHVIVEGFKALYQKTGTGELVLYGNSPELDSAYQRQIGEMAKGLPIELKGWDATWTSRLEASDIFVHAARDEPFGIVMLEAFARGCRLVVPPNTFLDDLPAPFNQLGIVRAAQANAGEFGEAMVKATAIQPPPDGFWEARKKVSPLFSAEAANERLAELYRQLAAEGVRNK